MAGTRNIGAIAGAGLLFMLWLLGVTSCSEDTRHVNEQGMDSMPSPFGSVHGQWQPMRTGFSAPFDQASVRVVGDGTKWEGSGLSYRFDLDSSGTSGLLSDIVAHSGDSAFLLRGGQEYSPAIDVPLADVPFAVVSVGIGLWLHAVEPLHRFTLVAELKRADGTSEWHGKDMDSLSFVKDSWNRLQGQFDLPDRTAEQGDILRIYLWSLSATDVHIDDLELVFRSDGVLGRTAGNPYRQEEPEASRLPPPFARFVYNAAVEPEVFGIIPGKVAPPMKDEVIALPEERGMFLHKPVREAIGSIRAADGSEHYLVRAWCKELGMDLFGYERTMLAEKDGQCVVIGYDVVSDPVSGKVTVAAIPAPKGCSFRLTHP